MTCICKSHSSVVFKKNGYEIFECDVCHLRFCVVNEDEESHLNEVYSDLYFSKGKEGYPDYFREQKILINHGIWYSTILGKHTQPGKLFDVGAAAGFIMLGFKQAGWNCTGIEPNEHMVEYGRTELNLNLKSGYIENYRTDEKFDLVTMIQVIGHLYDLNSALQNISNLVKENGLLLIECWDRGSIAARIQRTHWHEYSPPSVIYWFTRKTLNQKISDYGFELLKLGRPKKQISFRHALSLMSKEYVIFKAINYIADKILGTRDFFLTYPPTDVFYAIYKKRKGRNEQKNCFNIA